MAHNAIMTIGEKNKTPSKFQEISLTIQKTIDKAMICYHYTSKSKKPKTKQKISYDSPLPNFNKDKELTKQEQLPIKQNSLKPPIKKKPEFLETTFNKTSSLKSKPVKNEEKQRKAETLHQKNNYINQKEAVNLTSNETNYLNKRQTKSKSPFTRVDKSAYTTRDKSMSHKNPNKNLSMHNKKIETVEKCEIKQKPNEEKKEKINIIEDAKEKYNNHINFRSKRSKSSMILECIEEDIHQNFNDDQTNDKANNNFIKAIQKKGTLEIKSFNLVDEYIVKTSEANDFDIFDFKPTAQNETIMDKDENSVFDKEMNKFLENTFQRQETPPFSTKQDKSSCEKNLEVKDKIRRKSKKEDILYDPILHQYYDKNSNEYFQII